MFFMFKIYVNWERDQYHFLILFLLHFLCYFLFWEERDIKFEQKYLFSHDFNRGGLRKTNGTYHKWVKWYFSNPRSGNLNFVILDRYSWQASNIKSRKIHLSSLINNTSSLILGQICMASILGLELLFLEVLNTS